MRSHQASRGERAEFVLSGFARSHEQIVQCIAPDLTSVRSHLAALLVVAAYDLSVERAWPDTEYEAVARDFLAEVAGSDV